MPIILPILMNGEMVRATLDNRKTQTRRVITPQPEIRPAHENFSGGWAWENKNTVLMGWKDTDEFARAMSKRAPYQPGDTLWVRETFAEIPGGGGAVYRATWREDGWEKGPDAKWRPSIHMPKWACRLFLKVKTVRVVRLQQISVEDCIAEGVDTAETLCPVRRDGLHSDAWYDGEGCEACGAPSVHAKFRDIWDSLAKPGTRWADNPWVWVYEFEKCEKPEGWSNI